MVCFCNSDRLHGVVVELLMRGDNQSAHDTDLSITRWLVQQNKDMGAMEALMEAVGMETKRSNSIAADEDDDEMEPSTAGSPLGASSAPTLLSTTIYTAKSPVC